MKRIKSMSQVELAAYVQDALQVEGIQVVLSGGSAVSFYSSNKYVSKDLDLINTSFARRSRIQAVMENLGFKERGRYFIHPETTFFVEFPDGPLSVGEEPIKEVSEFELATGTLKVLSLQPIASKTGCVLSIFGMTCRDWNKLYWLPKVNGWI
jgi:hypothetical protein